MHDFTAVRSPSSLCCRSVFDPGVGGAGCVSSCVKPVVGVLGTPLVGYDFCVSVLFLVVVVDDDVAASPSAVAFFRFFFSLSFFIYFVLSFLVGGGHRDDGQRLRVLHGARRPGQGPPQLPRPARHVRLYPPGDHGDRRSFSHRGHVQSGLALCVGMESFFFHVYVAAQLLVRC